MIGGIFIVVYIDVLFIINFFITFLMLEITAKLCKKQAKTIRLILASAFGGLYSFIILIKELPSIVTSVSKIASALVIILIAFKFYRVKSMLVTFFVFIAISFGFLGVVLGLFFLTGSSYIAINNSTVYFDISTKQLLLSSLFAYLIACVIVKIYNRSVSKGEIYTLIIQNDGNEVTLFAFSDTGNKLREPFSNSPVIIANRKKLEGIYDEKTLRLIPASTVGSRSVLKAFKPDKVVLKTSKSKEVLENVYVALSDEIKNDSFSAIINPEILSV